MIPHAGLQKSWLIIRMFTCFDMRTEPLYHTSFEVETKFRFCLLKWVLYKEYNEFIQQNVSQLAISGPTLDLLIYTPFLTNHVNAVSKSIIL